MPTFRPRTRLDQFGGYWLSKPWHARVKREGLEWSLGYYETYAEAVEAEEKFNTEVIPRRRNQYG